MGVSDDDLWAIEERVAPLVGRRAWDVKRGHGSFVTLEFGEPVEREGYTRGAWHLWVYCCGWRLDDGDEVVAAYEDDRELLAQAVTRIEGRVLERVDLTRPALESVWWFEGGLALRVFPITTREYEHWMLYQPDGDVLTVGPGTSWSLSSEDQPKPGSALEG